MRIWSDHMLSKHFWWLLIIQEQFPSSWLGLQGYVWPELPPYPHAAGPLPTEGFFTQSLLPTHLFTYPHFSQNKGNLRQSLLTYSSKEALPNLYQTLSSTSLWLIFSISLVTTCKCRWVCMHLYTYVQVCICTYMHTHIHAHVNSCNDKCCQCTCSEE